MLDCCFMLSQQFIYKGGQRATTALDTSKGRSEISTETSQKVMPFLAAVLLNFEQKSEDPLLLYNSAATITLTTAKEESCNKRCQRSVD